MTRTSKVLIVEDDFMIADMTEEFLVKSGYEVCGIARTVEQAVALAQQHRPDLALVDFRLANGGLGTEVAVKLRESATHTIGIIYVTGNISQVDLLCGIGEAYLVKPYRVNDLLRALEITAEILATGIATPPFPRGFQLLNQGSASKRGVS
jgi:DNA-binding response OmpR family regulator